MRFRFQDRTIHGVVLIGTPWNLLGNGNASSTQIAPSLQGYGSAESIPLPFTRDFSYTQTLDEIIIKSYGLHRIE